MFNRLFILHSHFLLVSFLLLSVTFAQEEVVFKGYLEPSVKVMYQSKGHGELVYSAEEGAQVKEGDILFQQNSSHYADRKLSQESDIRKIEADQKVQKLNYENRIS